MFSYFYLYEQRETAVPDHQNVPTIEAESNNSVEDLSTSSYERLFKQLEQEKQRIDRNYIQIAQQRTTFSLQVINIQQQLQNNTTRLGEIEEILANKNLIISLRQKELDILKPKLERDNELYNSVTFTMLCLKSELDKLTRTYSTHQDSVEQQTQSQKLAQEISDTKAKIQACEKKLYEMGNDYQSISNRASFIKDQIDQLNTDIHDLQRESANLIQQHHILFNELRHSNEMLFKLLNDRQTCKALEEKHQALTSQLNEMSKKLIANNTEPSPEAFSTQPHFNVSANVNHNPNRDGTNNSDENQQAAEEFVNQLFLDDSNESQPDPLTQRNFWL